MRKASTNVSELDRVPSNSSGGAPFSEPFPLSCCGVVSVVVVFILGNTAAAGVASRGMVPPDSMVCSIDSMMFVLCGVRGVVPKRVAVWWSPAVMILVPGSSGAVCDDDGSSWTSSDKGGYPKPYWLLLGILSFLLVRCPSLVRSNWYQARSMYSTEIC